MIGGGRKQDGNEGRKHRKAKKRERKHCNTIKESEGRKYKKSETVKRMREAKEGSMAEVD